MATKKVVSNQESFAPMSIEEMRAAIAAEDNAVATVIGQDVKAVRAASESPAVVAGGVVVVGSSPQVAPAGAYALPSDLSSMFESGATETETEDVQATAIKLSMVGNRFKSINAYFAKSAEGVEGLRVLVAIIKQLGLSSQAITKTTKSVKNASGGYDEVPCPPFQFLKLSASANKQTPARLLFTLAESLNANKVSWS
jgi:hypothetical protein